MNAGFLNHENQLLDDVEKIRSIPTIIVQGRYDIVCPAETAYELSVRWPEATLVVAPFSGHSAFEKEITHELILATDKFGGLNS
jgi:proline iminopeptidase